MLKAVSDFQQASSSCGSVEQDFHPTHILAITSQPTPSTGTGNDESPKQQYALHPTHSSLLSSHCAALPQSLFQVSSSSPSSNHAATSIPIIPISIPHPKSFHLLQGYLYTHNTAALLTSLIPLSPSVLLRPSTESLAQFQIKPAQLSYTLTLPALLQSALQIHGLHANAHALHLIHSSPLWDTIESAWDLVRTALQIKVETSSQQLSTLSISHL
jgi:hypothetical protein